MTNEEKREYDRNWYHTNKDRLAEKKNLRAKQRRQEHYKRVQEYKAGQGCADCGESDPIVLELDHDDPSEKVDSVSMLVKRGCSWTTIESEIIKCTVRCANCHRRRTADQFWV